MRERFVALWRRSCPAAPADAVTAAFAELEALYGQPWRAYHTIGHIAACLERFDEVVEILDDADAVEMALWYHDAIYAISSPTNEADSAVLCEQRIGPYAAAAFAATVRDLILITDYPSDVCSADQAHMSDIDLHSFGLPWEAFAKDGRAVRAEYPARSDDDYIASQCRFMRTLMKNGHFYRSPFYKTHYEAQALANLERYLDLHAPQGGVA